MQDPEQGGAIAAPVKALLAFFDATDEWEGSPLHEELVRQLERHGIAARPCSTESWGTEFTGGYIARASSELWITSLSRSSRLTTKESCGKPWPSSGR
jgi:hypothetical protein